MVEDGKVGHGDGLHMHPRVKNARNVAEVKPREDARAEELTTLDFLKQKDIRGEIKRAKQYEDRSLWIRVAEENKPLLDHPPHFSLRLTNFLASHVSEEVQAVRKNVLKVWLNQEFGHEGEKKPFLVDTDIGLYIKWP